MSPRQQATAGPGLPQVNLLPPEVQAKRGLVRVKRWLGAAVVLSVLLAAGIVFRAGMAKDAADEELRVAQAETERLLAEQLEYSEVPIVQRNLETIKTARSLGMSTEILWPDYLSAIAATAPAGISIDTIGVSGATPILLATPPINPLQAPSVATVTFSAQSLTLPDTAGWLDGLETVPGFADGWFSTATITEEEGVALYTVSATVQIDERAYAERFAAEEEQS